MRLAIVLVCLSGAVVLGGALAPSRAAAQVDAQVDLSTDDAAPSGSRTVDRWFVGGYFRHLWVPFYVTEPFFDLAPSVTNNGFGLTLTYRTEGGLNFVFGGGYMPYQFSGLVLEEGNPATDTERIESDLGFVHLTGQLLWDVRFSDMFALELGFALDLGIFTGDMIRNEAYYDPIMDAFVPCDGPLDPPVRDADGTLYCETPRGSNPDTDPSDEKGEHYNVIDENLPPAFPFPSLPMVALRFNPHPYVGIKAEFGFGILQIWAGATLHVSFGLFAGDDKPEPVVEPDVAPPPEPAQIFGRVLGQVFDKETKVPIGGATVRVLDKAMSPLSTMDDGRFILDRLDPGAYRFQVEHPDFAPGTCEATIPPSGGDAAVHCMLSQVSHGGAISGQVKDDKDKPVQVPAMELTGPQSQTLSTDAEGLFAAVDLAPGKYRLKVEAEGYLMQMIDIEVLPNETALPVVILVPKPEPPKPKLVEVKKTEIVIKEQINFRTGKSKIESSSQALMQEIAGVLKHYDNIELVEIQGHTDNRGKRDYNQRLSEARANAVRDWLMGAGIAGERLVAKGYGPDHPLRPNDTKENRAVNRRVQFIIRKQK